MAISAARLARWLNPLAVLRLLRLNRAKAAHYAVCHVATLYGLPAALATALWSGGAAAAALGAVVGVVAGHKLFDALHTFWPHPNAAKAHASKPPPDMGWITGWMDANRTLLDSYRGKAVAVERERGIVSADANTMSLIASLGGPEKAGRYAIIHVPERRMAHPTDAAAWLEAHRDEAAPHAGRWAAIIPWENAISSYGSFGEASQAAGGDARGQALVVWIPSWAGRGGEGYTGAPSGSICSERCGAD
jgi:hypothetical protein